MTGLCEERDSGTPHHEQSSPNNNRPKTTAQQSPHAIGREVDIREIYKDLRSIMLESVQVLRSLKYVLADPMAQCAESYAGLVVRRLEKLCLIIYLIFVLVALCMFFFYEPWYG